MHSYTDKSKLIATSQETDLGIVRGTTIKIFAECMAGAKKCINYTNIKKRIANMKHAIKL